MRTSLIAVLETRLAVPEAPLMVPREVPKSMVSAERAYRGSTIAAMLLLLCSLWLFR